MSAPARSPRLWAGLALLALLLAALPLPAGCRREMKLDGRWRDESPAALLYEFRPDGSVWLVGEGALPVYRYEVANGVMQLYDGMGRRRELRYELTADRLVLYDGATGAVYGAYGREQ